MHFLRSSVLPLLLLLTPVISKKDNEHGPISSCILNCLATYALNEETFTCQTFKTNTALVDCIRECPVHDIDNFSHQVLGLPDNCEAQLYPGATGSITDTPTPTQDNGGKRPTSTDDDGDDDDEEDWRTDYRGLHNGGNCRQMRSDNTNSTRYTSWSGSCTKTEDSIATETGEATATDRALTSMGITTVTRTSNSSGTTTGPTSIVAGAAAFGAPSVGFLVLGVIAWAFVL